MDDGNNNEKYSSEYPHDTPLRGNVHGTTSSSTSTRWISRTPPPVDVNHDEDHYHHMHHRQQEKEQTAAGSTREGHYDSHSEVYPPGYYDAPTDHVRRQQHRDQQQSYYNNASAPPSYASTSNDNSAGSEKQSEKEQTAPGSTGEGQHDSHSKRYPPPYSYPPTDHLRRQQHQDQQQSYYDNASAPPSYSFRNDNSSTERQSEAEMPLYGWRPPSANQQRQQAQQPSFRRSQSYARHPNYGVPPQVQSRYYDDQQQQPASAAGLRGYEPNPHHQQQRYPPVAAPPAQYIVSPQMSPRLAPPRLTPSRFRVMVRPEVGPPDPWTSNIFGCLSDCNGCPLVLLAPCVAFGQIAEIMDSGYNSCRTAGLIYAVLMILGIPCIYSYSYRSRMRHRFNLREDPIDDLCVHFWCELCALSQEYRELAYRGIDPFLGYRIQEQIIVQAGEAPVSPLTLQEQVIVQAMDAPVSPRMEKECEGGETGPSHHWRKFNRMSA